MTAGGPVVSADPVVTVIVVTFNSALDILESLQSAIEAARVAKVSVELVVVDNASGDDSSALVRRAFPEAHVIQNETNVGFGRATNQAIRVASGHALLLLNPDARLASDALGVLLGAIDRLNAGGVAPSIGSRGAESAGMAPGIRSALGHFLWFNRLLLPGLGGSWRGVQLRRLSGREPCRVDWASAAVLLLDTVAAREIGGFDESFFLYGEDVDLGIRLDKANRSVWLVPTARASHRIAASQGGVSTGWVDALHNLSARTGSRFRVMAFDLVMAIGLTIRAMAAAAKEAGVDHDVHAARMRRAARRAWQLLWLTIAR